MANSNLPLASLLDNDDEDQDQPQSAPVAPQAPAPQDSDDSAPQQMAIQKALTGMSPDLSDVNLKNTLSKARSQQDTLELLKSINSAGAALSGLGKGYVVKPDQTLLTEQQQQAMNPVSDLSTRVQNLSADASIGKQNLALSGEEDANDPSSMKSQIYREAIIKMGFPPDKVEGASASDIQGAFGPIEKYLSSQQIAQLRAQVAEQNRQARDDAKADKQDVATRKEAQQAQDALNKDDVYKKAQASLSKADQASDQVEQALTNPTAANALPITLTSLSNGGQRINQAEMQAFGGSKAFSAKLNQFTQNASTGTLTPENAQFARDYINMTRNSFQNQADQAAQHHAQQWASRSGIKPEDAYFKLTGNEMSPSDDDSDDSDDKSPIGQPVKVQDPSTGKIHLIPQAQVNDAVKAGGKVIQ